MHVKLFSFKLITHQNNLKKTLGFIWAVSQIRPQAAYLLCTQDLCSEVRSEVALW